MCNTCNSCNSCGCNNRHSCYCALTRALNNLFSTEALCSCGCNHGCGCHRGCNCSGCGYRSATRCCSCGDAFTAEIGAVADFGEFDAYYASQYGMIRNRSCGCKYCDR